MKKKVLFILIAIFLLTGCSVDYTIEFDENKKVTETIYATQPDEFYSQHFRSSKSRVVADLLSQDLGYLNENSYAINNMVHNEQYGVKLEKTFSSFEEYREISKIYLEVVDDIEYIDENGIITIRANININTSEQDQSQRYIKDLTINIKLPFDVTNSNADSVKGDIYTWNFNKDNNNHEIEISYKKNYIKKEYIVYAIIGVFAIIGLFIYMIIKNRALKNNEI